MSRLFLLSGAMLLHLFHTEPARACGMYPGEVFPLLPQDGADAVPLNAVLTAAANNNEPQFTLRVVEPRTVTGDGGAPDGAAPSVDAVSEAGAHVSVITECEQASSDYFCRARIDGQLRPNTDYEWTVSAEGVEGYGWRRFRTGDSHSARHTAPDVPVRVVLNDYISGEFCDGPERIALEFDAKHIDQAYVIDIFGLSYQSWSYARVIEPGVLPVRTNFSDPADCVNVAAFDVTGERYDLRRVCFDDELPPTIFSDAGVVDRPDVADGGESTETSGGNLTSDESLTSGRDDTDLVDSASPDAGTRQPSDAGNVHSTLDAQVEQPPAEVPKAQRRRDSRGCSITSSPPSSGSTWLWWSVAMIAGGLRRRRSVPRL